MKILRRFFIRLSFLATAFAIAFLAACWSSPAIPFATPTHAPNAPPRTIVTSTLPLREVWRRPVQVRIGGSISNPSTATLAVLPGAVYAVEFQPDPSLPLAPWRIVALDAQTGNQLWTSQRLGLVDSLAVSDQLLFVASKSGIQSYDVKTGQLKWISNQPSPDHQFFMLTYDESRPKLIVVGPANYSYTALDPETGKVGDLNSSPNDVIAFDSQHLYRWQNNAMFSLTDIDTQVKLWNLPLVSMNPPWPMVRSKENVVILPSVARDGWHSVAVVELITGHLLWQCLDCFASDVAAGHDTVYAIRRDGSLGAFELKTGEPRGIVQFAGKAALDPLNTQYSVAVTGKAVYVYFGDSGELIALSLSSK